MTTLSNRTGLILIAVYWAVMTGMTINLINHENFHRDMSQGLRQTHLQTSVK